MIQNRRDLGGIRTADGRTVRPGLLLRSAHLFQAEEEDLAGISLVIDLRTPGERAEAPDSTWGRELAAMPVFTDAQAGVSHEMRTEKQALPDMAHLYGKLINKCADSFSAILRTIMRHDFSSGAVLWHCTEGKDRTGMVAALLLEMLGADRSVILEDYLKTNIVNLPKAIRVRERLAATRGEDFAECAYRAYLADERYLRAAWDAMGENYIPEKLGITGAETEAFRERVLEERRD